MKIFFFLIFVFMPCAVISVLFEQEKNYIDRYVTEGDQPQPAQMYDYVMHYLTDVAPIECRPDIDKALRQLDTDKIICDSYASILIFGGLCFLKNITQKNTVRAIDVMEAVDIASVLISPDLYNPTYKFADDEYVMYKRVLMTRDQMAVWGKKFLDPETRDQQFLSFYQTRAKHDQMEMMCMYFKPLIMVGEYAVFSERAFLYALKQGVVLIGLTYQVQSVHGGIYDIPATLSLHDAGHVVDMMSPHHGDVDDRQILADYYIRLAGRFYAVIYEDQIFGVHEQLKATIAAFYLLHENKLYLSTYALLEVTEEDRISVMLKSFITSFNRRLQASGIISPEDFEGAITDDRFYLHAKFASDYAVMIARLYPHKILDIFGKKYVGSVRVFNADVVRGLTLDLVTWFCGRFIKKEG